MSLNEPNENGLNIVADPKQVGAQFCDLVQMNATRESVQFSFLSLMPGSTPQRGSATLISTVTLTWPHIVRLTQMLNDTIKAEKDSVINHLNEHFSRTGE